MSSRIYIEGGGDSKELHTRCREGFRKLIEKIASPGSMPRLVPSGGRGAAFDDFKTAHRHASEKDYVALLVDSEDVVDDIEKPWEHVRTRDGWDKPVDATDEQVLLMVTSMETWISADRSNLRKRYGNNLKEKALPPLTNLEQRERKTVFRALCDATRDCSSSYRKGKHSFELLAELSPEELRKHLASFVRFERILKDNL